MKVRVFVIEADEVDAGDLRDLFAQFTGRPALPAAQPAPSAPLPPSVPTAIVKSKPGWRPQGRKPRDSKASDPQPKTPLMVQCSQCGAELPEGHDRRSKCLKCNCRAWEEIPARGEPVLSDE